MCNESLLEVGMFHIHKYTTVRLRYNVLAQTSQLFVLAEKNNVHWNDQGACMVVGGGKLQVM